jgi:hypothetical protein
MESFYLVGRNISADGTLVGIVFYFYQGHAVAGRDSPLRWTPFGARIVAAAVATLNSSIKVGLAKTWYPEVEVRALRCEDDRSSCAA